jgi:hypothetical protein
MVRLIVPNGDRNGERAPRGGAAGYRVPTPLSLSLRGLRATLVLRTVTLDSAIARELRDKWLRPALAGFGQGID